MSNRRLDGPTSVFMDANPIGRKTKGQRESAEKLGLALLLNRTTNRTLAFFRHRVFPAIHLNQIRFFFNDNGQVVGYVIWANLAHDVEERLRDNPEAYLHTSEWNEGESLWILDLIAPAGHFKNIVKELDVNVFRSYTAVSYSRKNRDKVYYVTVRRAEPVGAV
ncbi:MAG TPA: toxin-activating lysine-acyltransferase [Burkholderiaceae bacterium]